MNGPVFSRRCGVCARMCSRCVLTHMYYSAEVAGFGDSFYLRCEIIAEHDHHVS
jgi:ferredoxin